MTTADVARVRAATSSRKNAWTIEEISARLPKPLVADDHWTFTASHNAATARNALSLSPWTTGTAQQAGMWLQVELPRVVSLAEILFDSESATGRGGGGGGAGGAGRAGRGGAGVGGPPNAGGQIPPPANAGAPGAGRGAGLGAGPGLQSGGGAVGSYPRGYQVQVSMDGTTWSAPVAEGRGTGRSTVISFAPVQAKFVRITQTATVDAAPPWAVMTLRLYEAGQTPTR